MRSEFLIKKLIPEPISVGFHWPGKHTTTNHQTLEGFGEIVKTFSTEDLCYESLARPFT